MAELVAAIGVPHSPHYPSQYPKDGPDHTSRTYRAVKQHLDAAKADAIVVIANDHFNTFFLNNFPTFAVGVAEASFGPNDQTKMPHYDFAVHTELATHVVKVGMSEGFDFAVTQDFGVDHAMLVPLYYLTDAVKIPVVPIWVNAFVKPLPSARRCYALGRMLKGAIDSLPRNLRVAVLATGQLFARNRRPPGRSWRTPWHARHRLVEARPPPHQERRDHGARDRGHARAHVEGRQYRRRTAELDRHARYRRHHQAMLSGRS